MGCCELGHFAPAAVPVATWKALLCPSWLTSCMRAAKISESISIGDAAAPLIAALVANQ